MYSIDIKIWNFFQRILYFYYYKANYKKLSPLPFKKVVIKLLYNHFQSISKILGKCWTRGNWFEEGRFYWSRNYLELCVRVHCSKLGFLVKFRTIPKAYFLNHKKRFENVQFRYPFRYLRHIPRESGVITDQKIWVRTQKYNIKFRMNSKLRVMLGLAVGISREIAIFFPSCSRNSYQISRYFKSEQFTIYREK